MDAPIEIAWAAGLFEGEGSILYGKYTYPSGRDYTRRRLSMQMSDEDVLRRFVAIVDAGKVIEVTRQHRVNRENHTVMFVWEINRWADVERITKAFLPYLGERRRTKAEALLADPAGPIGRPPKAVA